MQTTTIIEFQEREVVSASGAVNFFIEEDARESCDLTNLKLNKLIYIAHGFMLAKYQKPLLNVNYHEYVEAWQYGPVIPSIYHEFKHFGRSNISEHGSCLIEIDPINGIQKIKPKIVNNNVLSILKWVFNNFAKLSAMQLVDITHAQGSPWQNAYIQGNYNVLIADQETKEYYTQYLEWLITTKGFQDISN